MPLTSAVIDRRSSEALIALAFKERLIYATEETDGMFEKICRANYDPNLQAQLLEQFVLTPKLSFCDFDPNIWRALDGDFKQYIANLDAPPEDDLPLQPLPIEMISGMTGKEITEEAMQDLVNRVRICCAEQEQYERVSGKKAPSISDEQMKQILGKVFSRGAPVPSDYMEAELEAQRRRNSVYYEFSPVIDAMQEYARLAKVADRFELLVRTPILNSSVPGPVIQPKFDPSVDAELAIFRIVAHQLGKTTYRPTLAGSLKLARESATNDLREMLPFWYTRLAEGDERELSRLQAEIGRASAALEGLEGVKKLGTHTTWLALPISAVEALLKLSPIISTVVSLAGYLGSNKEQKVSKKYHWASYGSL